MKTNLTEGMTSVVAFPAALADVPTVDITLSRFASFATTVNNTVNVARTSGGLIISKQLSSNPVDMTNAVETLKTSDTYNLSLLNEHNQCKSQVPDNNNGYLGE